MTDSRVNDTSGAVVGPDIAMVAGAIALGALAFLVGARLLFRGALAA